MLCTCKRSLLRFWNKKFRKISWFLCSKWYSFVSRCIWELRKYVSWNIWSWSCKIPFRSWLRMTSSFKKIKGKLDLLTDIDMLLMVEKNIREGICHSVYWYTKANNKYMEAYNKKREFSYIQYWDVNNLYGWTMSKWANE